MIKQFLSSDKFTTREELSELTGLHERDVRHEIRHLKETIPVIYNSHTKGYRLPKDIETLTLDGALEEYELIKHSLNDIESRINVFQDQKAVYLNYLNKLCGSMKDGR